MGRDATSSATLNVYTEEVQDRLGGLLKRCRARIGPDRLSLGQYLRPPMRIGKTVSQEEVAEVVGISRQWYLLMEGDHAVHVSAAILARVADALMMNPAERAALFRLAVPELRSVSLMDRSTAMLDAFGSLRRLTRHLWAATTEAEVLTVVRDYAMMQFAPAVILTSTRVGEGRWDLAATGDFDEDGDRLKRFEALVRERWGGAVIDDLCCYTLMARPGDLVTRSEREARFPDLAAKNREALDAVGLDDHSFAMANIRSQRGFVGHLNILRTTTAQTYSELELAQLSTLADLTSLALSGCVSSRSQ
ncbi:MAG: transcriptional regulator [Candidatus Eremiobacteraeota bacterium]|nr:transcriptional regulator [Candidatus Eremiobacteraeota bacterium]